MRSGLAPDRWNGDTMADVRQFEFQLDQDLGKLVEVHQYGQQLRVEVKYFDTAIIEQTHTSFRIVGVPDYVAGEITVAVRWRQPLTPWAKWPAITKTRHF